MNKRKVTLAAAAAGVVTGVVGLGALAMPAGAGQPPNLPEVDAQSLVQSVLTAKPGAFGGTVEAVNSLGLPAISGIPQLADGTHSARMWSDGEGRLRLSLPDGQSEQTIVDDGTTTWSWDSRRNEVGKLEHGQNSEPQTSKADPVATARELVAEIQKSSDVKVDGTARVANRAAYELVLTPKPTEKTLLREVRVAVDSEMRIPLRAAIYTNGTNAPAAQVGFSDMNVGPQDPALFKFTPAPGSKVVEGDKEQAKEHVDTVDQAFTSAKPQIFGEGWDTVIGVRVPAEALGQVPAEGQGLIEKFTKQVNGAWGSGKLFTTKVGNILLADDGRVVAGAVPEQVLFDTIGQVK
ncbi:membrane protein [Lentzea sp. NBRC 105346]|uniref:LolA family protein n=1 Tax=Lentzea sp. NBRC 105346 TaxID=3032205 RepID=UPI0024A22EA4|nr:sigma-E factor regulatory protein RseB domain-containing protein [Lentzea sp. NBRC 105346]GLZ35609.1 membrane protein [Lentzea sp. NBRC 105346]